MIKNKFIEVEANVRTDGLMKMTDLSEVLGLR